MSQINSLHISPGSKDALSNNQSFTLQNGNKFQLTGNKTVASANNTPTVLEIKNSPGAAAQNNVSSLSGTKNVILNSLHQGNLNQRIKMTTLKSGTVLNLNTSNYINYRV